LYHLEAKAQKLLDEILPHMGAVVVPQLQLLKLAEQPWQSLL
jgi:hypothetical protein